MQFKFLPFLMVIFCNQLLAQSSMEEQSQTEQNLIRSWVKYRVDVKDGSELLDKKIAKEAASMLIFKKGGGGVILFGSKAFQTKYTVSNKSLIIDGTTIYDILKLTENELIFSQNTPNKSDNELIRYHYISTTESSSQYFYRQFIKPFVHTIANGDTAYAFNENIFPKFKDEINGHFIVLDNFNDVYEASYDFIENKFRFPANKKGNFSVSFTVDKKGEIKDVEVEESSDSSYNNSLILAVYQTRKRWLAAEYPTKKVDVLFNYVFKYEESSTEDVFDFEIYANKKDKANRFFLKKDYVKAIKLYTECILMQDEDLEPLYKRADCYFALKVNKNACLDWSYLAKKGQKKAEQLFMENCMK